MRAEAGERDGVGADVALQMDTAQPGDVSEPRQVEPDDVTQEVRVLRELRDVVVGRGRVRGGALVPLSRLISA